MSYQEIAAQAGREQDTQVMLRQGLTNVLCVIQSEWWSGIKALVSVGPTRVFFLLRTVAWRHHDYLLLLFHSSLFRSHEGTATSFPEENHAKRCGLVIRRVLL